MAIYIPSKIRVGYQDREDTFTKRLAYVIYYDNWGKLRKELSWEQWRDQKIEPQEFENVPTTGFVLNKGHTRYNWSHFGNSKTTRIRIYDPRGIEFEITAENLVAVLMHTDCSRREIAGELVYAWNGTELMLLPCTSEEYLGAKKYTELQAKKFSAKDLKEGATYLTKAEKKVVYLGRFDYYRWVSSEKENIYQEFKKSREHIFVSAEDWPGCGSSEEIKNHFYKPLTPSAQLAVCVTEEIPENFATLVDWYLKNSQHASPITHFSIRQEKCRDSDEWNGCWYELRDNGKSLQRWEDRSSWWHSYGKRGWTACRKYTPTCAEHGGKVVQTRPSDLVMGYGVAHYANGAKSNVW